MTKSSFANIATQFIAGAATGFDATQATLYARGSLGELGSQVWGHYGESARVDGKLSAVRVFELLQADGYIDAEQVPQSQNCKFVAKHMSTYSKIVETYFDGMLVPLAWGIGDANGKARMKAAIAAGAIETRVNKDGKAEPKRFNSQHPVYAALVRSNPEKPVKAKPAPRQTVASSDTPEVSAKPDSDKKTSAPSLAVATLSDWSNIGAAYMAQKPSKSQRAAVLAKLASVFGLESDTE
jgi:hypothetical protein